MRKTIDSLHCLAQCVACALALSAPALAIGAAALGFAPVSVGLLGALALPVGAMLAGHIVQTL